MTRIAGGDLAEGEVYRPPSFLQRAQAVMVAHPLILLLILLLLLLLRRPRRRLLLPLLLPMPQKLLQE